MRLNKAKTFRLFTAVAAALIITGCGSTSTPVPGSPPPPPTTVVVTPATATVYRGKTQLFTATVSGQADQTVIWRLDGNGSIDSTGLYTAPSDSDKGAVVTATSKAVPSESGTALVTLPTIPFSITPGAVGIVPGASQTFSATVVGLDSTQVNWTVQGGGTITSAGLYSAPSTSGLSYVVATSSANANYSATAVVIVATNTTVLSSPTGNLQDGREFHTATLLPNGKVLVAGGAHQDTYCLAGIASAELYDPAVGSFVLTGSMTIGRYAQTSTLLPTGKVLVAGGFSSDPNSDCFELDGAPALTTTDLYDPSDNSFAPTGNMAEERAGHTAILLTNGKVLIAGGDNLGGGVLPFFDVDGSVTAELYDPATGLFTSTGKMDTPRVGQTATLLVNGDVLIAGGWSASQNASIATAELYHAATGTFTPTGSMNSPRAGHTATLLPDGKVLIAGGVHNQTLVDSDSAEIYDPATGSFLATGSMAVKRCSQTATLLPNGIVLLVDGGSLVTEIYDPSTGSFVLSGLTKLNRFSGHSATLLQNGNVLVVGGLQSPTTAELYP